MAIKISAEKDDIDTLKTLLGDKGIVYRNGAQTGADLGDGPKLLTDKDLVHLFIDPATVGTVGKSMGKDFSWFKTWLSNHVKEKSTSPKVTLIEKNNIDKGSVTVDPSKPNESLRKFKLFLEGR